MSKQTEIGQGFKDKLAELKRSPDPEVWDQIDAAFPEKKRRAIPLWFLLIGGILLFSSGIFIGNEFSQQSEFQNSENNRAPSQTNLSNTEEKGFKSIEMENPENPDLLNAEEQSKEHVAAAIHGTNKNSNKITFSMSAELQKRQIIGKTAAGSKTEKKSMALNLTDQPSINNKMVSSSENKTLDHPQDKLSTPKTIANSNNSQDDSKQTPTLKKSQSDLEIEKVAENKNDNEKNADEKEKEKRDIEPMPSISKWGVTVQGMGEYYFNTSSANSISTALNANEQSLNLNFNYGFTLNYNVSDKLQLRIGANNQKLEQVYENIDTPDLSFSDLNNVKTSVNETTYNTFVSNSNVLAVNQTVQYFNIPLEVRYEFLTKKIRLSAITGLNFSGLVENKVTLNNSIERLEIGSNNKIKKFNYGVHAGLGSRYPLFKNSVFLNADLIINYQPFTYLDIPNVNPAILSTRLGLEYKF
jgi:hypothetical protein